MERNNCKSDKPILFSTRMVQSTITDLKNQTRRLIKLPSWSTGDWKDFETDGKTAEIICKDTGCQAVIKCPYGKPGDILWVRETWAKIEDFTNYADLKIEKDLKYLFKCDDNGMEPTCIDVGVKRWGPSIHMPKAACRTRLKVTDIRIERLQDISEEDAKVEGVDFCTPSHRHEGWNDRWISGYCHDCACYDPMTGLRPRCYHRTEGEGPRFRYSSGCNSGFKLRDDSIPEPYRLKFACYWDELNAANGYGHGWGQNDWLWAISFEKVKP